MLSDNVKIYDDKDVNNVRVCFIIKNNNVTSVVVGNMSFCDEKSIMFYVDDFVAEQIHKFNLVLDGFEPKLELKEGEQLFVPEENNEYKKQKEIEELEKRLNELKAD